MEKTAGSLDNLELEMLFVSIQQNNLELCITYAVRRYVFTIYHEISVDDFISLEKLSSYSSMVRATILIQG